MKTLLQILALLTVTVAAGRADINMSIVLDNPNQTGLPGSTLQFFGTITNTGDATVFLISDSIDLSGGAAFNITDLFLDNVPFSLDPGVTSKDIELFDVALADPFTDPPGLNDGSYTLMATDGASQSIFTTAGFSVTVSTPEPEYCGILTLTIVGLLFASSRRRPRVITR
jgi:hypothetical protein